MTGTFPTGWALGPVAAALAVLWLCSPQPASAQAFECPAPQGQQGPGMLKETSAQVCRTASLLGSGDASNRVPEIVAGLRKRHPGVQDDALVNYLTTAYCPVVARLSGLGDAEKKARLDRFASQVS